MIEETLSQYGALGAVILFFMGTLTWILKWVTSNLSKVIEQNTIAFTTNTLILQEVKQTLNKCKLKGGYDNGR